VFEQAAGLPLPAAVECRLDKSQPGKDLVDARL
jgi:hypothetical protein